MNDKEKAVALINAFFDGKDIILKDPKHGVPDWVSIKDSRYWNYLTLFCKNVDCYRIVE